MDADLDPLDALLAEYVGPARRTAALGLLGVNSALVRLGPIDRTRFLRQLALLIETASARAAELDAARGRR